jgi:hypothetical protein
MDVKKIHSQVLAASGIPWLVHLGNWDTGMPSPPPHPPPAYTPSHLILSYVKIVQKMLHLVETCDVIVQVVLRNPVCIIGFGITVTFLPSSHWGLQCNFQ